MPKRAFLDITPEFAGQGIGILEDGGLRIVGSDANPYPETIRLLIEGDALPTQCARGPLRLVRVIVSSEAYGRQRIHRLSQVELID